ncbi:unnamed protein product, partial [Oppiella nova]
DKDSSDEINSISLAANSSSLSVALNHSSSSSISDCDKGLSTKSLSTTSNDSSLSSSSTSSATLPLNSSDVQSGDQLSDSHHILSVDVGKDSQSNGSTTCSSSKAFELTLTPKSNRELTQTPPPLSSLSASELTTKSSSSAAEVCVQSESTPKPFGTPDVNDSLVLNIESTSQPLDAFVSESKDKTLNGYERTYSSHLIESVLRNTSPSEQCNARTGESDRTVGLSNHSLTSSSLNTKLENSNKENNSYSLDRICSKAPKSTSSSTNCNNFQINSSNVSNCVKSVVKDSHSVGVKRTASPPLSNQSTAAKQNRHSSPNNQKSCDSLNTPLHPSAAQQSRGSTNSLSSLSHLSQSIGQSFNTSREREETSSTKSSSARTTPSVTVSNSSPDNTFPNNYSTPKSHLWTSSSSSTGLNGSAVPHLSPSSLTPRSATPNIGLSSSVHSNHSNHLAMFASPIPPALPSVGGAVAPSATPSPFIGDSLFSHQNQSDFLRRELDTRFLASLDRTIAIPPPPYMRTEMHQHIHAMPQNQPFPMTPAMASPLVQQSNPHLAFPKLDQTTAYFNRNPLSLSGFPSLSPLLTPGGSTITPQTGSLTASATTPFGPPGHSAAFQPKLNSFLSGFPSLSPLLTPGGSTITPQTGSLTASATTPFGPPGHSAAFQPKLNSLSTKTKPSAKSGRWCAMHVRIAWEIYHHQQKQQQMDLSHKSGVPSGTGASKSGSSDLLRPLNHMFSLGPRTQELPPFSSPLMSAAPSRTPFDSPLPSHHNQFGSTPPSPHLSSRTTNFTRFPSFGNFSSLGLPPVAGPPTPSGTLFGPTPISGARDLPIPGCLPGLSASGPDLWSRSASTRPTPALFPPLTASTSSSTSSASWGGLKAEAERNRLNEDLYHKRKHSESGDKDAKRFEREKSRSDDKIEAKHKDQLNSHKQSSNSSLSHVRNGDIFSDKNKDWLKMNNEQKEENGPNGQTARFATDANDTKGRTTLTTTSSASNLLNPSSTLAAMGLNNQLEKARFMSLFGGLHGTPPPVTSHYNTNNSAESLRSYWNPLIPAVDPFKSLHELQVRPDFLDRDNIFQRYSLLNSSGGGASLMERIAKESAEKEMLSHSIEKHNSKLIASHMRSNDMSFTSGLPGGHNPRTPHTSHPHIPPPQPPNPSSSASSIYPANPYLNSLHSLSASAGSYMKTSKSGSTPLHTSSSSSSETSSPSLGPTNGTTLAALVPNVLNHSLNITNSKLSIGSLIDNQLETIHRKSSESKAPTTGLVSSNGNTSDVEILETNSR